MLDFASVIQLNTKQLVIITNYGFVFYFFLLFCTNTAERVILIKKWPFKICLKMQMEPLLLRFNKKINVKSVTFLEWLLLCGSSVLNSTNSNYTKNNRIIKLLVIKLIVIEEMCCFSCENVKSCLVLRLYFHIFISKTLCTWRWSSSLNMDIKTEIWASNHFSLSMLWPDIRSHFHALLI